jgi:hypothetical protein
MPDKKPDSPKKSRAENHSPEEEPNFNTVLGADENDPAATAKGISRASAVLLALMASLVGGAIGWGGPILFGNSDQKTDALQSALTQTQAELSQATKDRQALGARLDQLQTDARAKGSATKNVTQQLLALQAELDELKARPVAVDNSTALEELKTSVSTLTEFSVEEGETQNLLDLINRLEALEQQTPTDEDLTARLDTLETDFKAFGEREPVAVFPKPDTTPIEIPTVNSEQDQRDALQVLIDSFPRTKMLEAVKAQEILATKKPSWLQRMLSRHVKVRDDDQSKPADVIDQAETALKGGKIAEAIRLINTLNPPVKAVAADWITAAKKTAKLIEKDL